MRKSIVTAVAISFVIALAPCTPPEAALAIPARQQARLSLSEEKALKAMIEQHRRVRARLRVADRNLLDQLTGQMRKDLFAHLPQTNLFGSTRAMMHKRIPGLTDEETASMSEYVLGGIAGNDPDPIGAAAGGSSQDDLLNATKQMQETQMSFNLQYLQLQNSMQSENRQFTMVSNIMKTKHDTVKNSINNVR